MAKARVGARLVAGCLLGLGGASTVWAAPPSVAQMLELFRPKHEGVAVSTPTAQEQQGCKVELVQAKGGSGWMLRDAGGRPLRRFFDSNADKQIDVWSYYQDGVEVYREADVDYNQKVNHYRWMNAGGGKWGVDANEDGTIDSWQAISAEEVSQEILQALLTKNFARLEALWVGDADVKALGLPAIEVNRLRELVKQAPAKFQAAAAKLSGLSAQTHWLRLETAAPVCLPAEQTGGKEDLVKYLRGTIYCEDKGKNEAIQTGELVQVRTAAGVAWRVVEAPAVGEPPATPVAGEGGQGRPVDPAVQKLLDELQAHDRQAPKREEGMGPNPEVARYNLRRADLLGRIVQAAKAEDRDPWVRQVADCLNAAAQASDKADKAASERLAKLATDLAKEQPGSALAAYVTFREMQADYALKLSAPGQEYQKVQEAWLERLAGFIQTYPKADDAADALLQLGMVSEFMGKETEAKNWYARLAKDFPDRKALADKAQGALARLELEGKELHLAGPGLDGGSHDIARHRGKVVIVYYWASWTQQCVGDFAKLKLLLNTYSGKGLELLCVNLDNSAGEAQEFLRRAPAPGAHLHQPGGMDSPLATQYGVILVPNLFLVGKEGKLVSRTVQMSNLEEEVKKLLK